MSLLSKDKRALSRIVKFLNNLDCLQATQQPSFLTVLVALSIPWRKQMTRKTMVNIMGPKET